MIRAALRSPLRRLLTFLSIPLLAVGTTVVTAAPAHAALVFQGNFNITLGNLCATIANNGTTNRTPIVREPCNGSNAQRWAIFLATDQNAYWILGYGGDQRFNVCMDRGESNANPIPRHMWIFGCHGGSQQRWTLSINTTSSQQIRNTGTTGCVGFKQDLSNALAIQACRSVNPPNPEIAPRWVLVPA